MLDGKEVNFKSSKEALENGVAMVHQELNQALTRSVMDNLWLGRYPKVGGHHGQREHHASSAPRRFSTSWKSTWTPRPSCPPCPCPSGRWWRSPRPCRYNSKIIVFDEPTSSLTETEVEHLFRIINMLRDQGCGIIYISPQNGRDPAHLATKSPSCATASGWPPAPAKDADHGRDHQADGGPRADQPLPAQGRTSPARCILEVEHLTGGYTRLKDDVSSSCARARSWASPGWTAPAARRLLENIFGVDDPQGSGTHHACTARRSATATRANRIKNGFALLTEERRATGIFGIREHPGKHRHLQPEQSYLMGGICLQRQAR